jgi:hypothetical protein
MKITLASLCSSVRPLRRDRARRRTQRARRDLERSGFQKAFIGGYGINAEVEPRVTSEK